jgi:hypothetical protein
VSCEVEIHAIRAMLRELDEFVGDCMDEQGNPKAPSKKALMLARSILPPGYKHTLTKPKQRGPQSSAPTHADS